MQEQTNLQNLDGINNIEFSTHRSELQQVYYDLYNHTQGYYLPTNLVAQDKLNLTSGSYPSNNNEIIISNTFANTLIENHTIDDNIIGQKITGTIPYDKDISFVITGTYDSINPKNFSFIEKKPDTFLTLTTPILSISELDSIN